MLRKMVVPDRLATSPSISSLEVTDWEHVDLTSRRNLLPPRTNITNQRQICSYSDLPSNLFSCVFVEDRARILELSSTLATELCPVAVLGKTDFTFPTRTLCLLENCEVHVQMSVIEPDVLLEESKIFRRPSTIQT
ncbi:MAG: hypothetical protein ABSB29_08285 [Nitrososphaerales archaeon]